MTVLPLAFAASAAVTILVLVALKRHAPEATDGNFRQPQKFHTVAVPRIGGVGILAGMLAGVCTTWHYAGREAGSQFLIMLTCAAPAFLAGLLQDLTEALTPSYRLVATALSALLAFVFINAAIRHTSIPGLDWLVSFGPGSLFITMFAVAGIANAFNIIDGFNGLASMCSVLMLTVLGYVAFQVHDPLTANLSLAGVGAVLGFFLWNYPAGWIFLGDGGAYLLGFYVSETSILLLQRNPGAVSPLFPLLVCIYPVFETVFSIYRRAFLRSQSPSKADGIHLHSLIYRRVVRPSHQSRGLGASTWRNSMTSPYLWVLCMLSAVPAALFYDNSAILAGLLVLFGLSYVTLYWRIVRFKSPRWLTILAKRDERRGGDHDGAG